MKMITHNTISEKNIKWTRNLRNGGYATYWKLYGQLLAMLSNKHEMMNKIRDRVTLFENITGYDLQRKVKRELIKAKVSAYTWMFVWSCLLKPLGQFFSREVLIVGRYKIINGRFNNTDLVKSTTYKLFGISVWYMSHQKFTDEEMKDLLK